MNFVRQNSIMLFDFISTYSSFRLRFFYISSLFDTCEGDKLWFCTIEGIDTMEGEPVCWYEYEMEPSIIFSKLRTVGTSEPGTSH